MLYQLVLMLRACYLGINRWTQTAPNLKKYDRTFFDYTSPVGDRSAVSSAHLWPAFSQQQANVTEPVLALKKILTICSGSAQKSGLGAGSTSQLLIDSHWLSAAWRLSDQQYLNAQFLVLEAMGNSCSWNRCYKHLGKYYLFFSIPKFLFQVTLSTAFSPTIFKSVMGFDSLQSAELDTAPVPPRCTKIRIRHMWAKCPVCPKIRIYLCETVSMD